MPSFLRKQERKPPSDKDDKDNHGSTGHATAPADAGNGNQRPPITEELEEIDDIGSLAFSTSNMSQMPDHHRPSGFQATAAADARTSPATDSFSFIIQCHKKKTQSNRHLCTT